MLSCSDNLLVNKIILQLMQSIHSLMSLPFLLRLVMSLASIVSQDFYHEGMLYFVKVFFYQGNSSSHHREIPNLIAIERLFWLISLGWLPSSEGNGGVRNQAHQALRKETDTKSKWRKVSQFICRNQQSRYGGKLFQ